MYNITKFTPFKSDLRFSTNIHDISENPGLELFGGIFVHLYTFIFYAHKNISFFLPTKPQPNHKLKIAKICD